MDTMKSEIFMTLRLTSFVGWRGFAPSPEAAVKDQDPS